MNFVRCDGIEMIEPTIETEIVRIARLTWLRETFLCNSCIAGQQASLGTIGDADIGGRAVSESHHQQELVPRGKGAVHLRHSFYCGANCDHCEGRVCDAVAAADQRGAIQVAIL